MRNGPHGIVTCLLAVVQPAELRTAMELRAGGVVQGWLRAADEQDEEERGWDAELHFISFFEADFR